MTKHIIKSIQTHIYYEDSLKMFTIFTFFNAVYSHHFTQICATVLQPIKFLGIVTVATSQG